MRAKKHSSVLFVITALQKRNNWKYTFHQSTRAKNHSNVSFVITTFQKVALNSAHALHQIMMIKKHSLVPSVSITLQQSRKLLCILQQFMRAQHSSVPSVISNFHWRGGWQGTLHQFLKAKDHSCVPFVISHVWAVFWPLFASIGTKKDKIGPDKWYIWGYSVTNFGVPQLAVGESIIWVIFWPFWPRFCPHRGPWVGPQQCSSGY